MGSYLIVDKTLKLNNFSNGDIHYDIYNFNKYNKNTTKIKKNEENNSSFESNFNEDFFSDEGNINNNSAIIKYNNKNKNSKAIKELDDLIKKMNKLYFGFQNHSK